MAVLEKIVHKIFGDPHQKKVNALQPLVDQINQLEPEMEKLSDAELAEKTPQFRARLQAGETLDDLLVDAFATVRETAKRVLNMRHFDVQLVGGIVLHQGKIAEMKTGEGKTLVSTLPAYLNALDGQGVYIVTVNDYLARRDSGWMGKIYTALGLSVGLIQSGMAPEDRLNAYNADITFGTNNEFGFDYLRDNLSVDAEHCCQRRRHFAIIDEVDSILVDEARTPLVISGPVQVKKSQINQVVRQVRRLKKEDHFTLDEKHKNAVLTEPGISEFESMMAIKNMYSLENMELAHMAVQCLRALYLFKKDVDYVIKDGQVMIVDEFTGRLLEGRRYSDGLHQAIEAVEGLSVREESQTLASITFQNYFRLFPKLAGMTGTAVTEEEEFRKIYGLEVVVIPTHRPMVRQDNADVVYKTKGEKYKAIIQDVVELHKKGQPVLVGTISIEISELLSGMLKKHGIVHHVLNAKHHEKEAEIIARAGQKGAVTIATNMAGRGTDIVLGEGVAETGGLFVVGSERHESRRIDNQLRGRSGRQGDSGASRFYVALDDDLMRLFGSDRIARVMDRLGVPDDTPIEHGLISKSIERAQSKVEQYHFSVRKQILQYDDVLNKQRETIYTFRRQLLHDQNIDSKIKENIDLVVRGLATDYLEPSNPAGRDIEGYKTGVTEVFGDINEAETLPKPENPNSIDGVVDHLFSHHMARQNRYPEGVFSEVSRQVFLRTVDRRWVDHLQSMEALREGIGLRAWGQRDPLIEYKIEAFDMFQALLIDVAKDSLTTINRMQIVKQDGTSLESTTPDMQYNRDPVSTPQTNSKKIGRNDPCHCGSGRKYKKCCMT